jgi:hypothetical protein
MPHFCPNMTPHCVHHGVCNRGIDEPPDEMYIFMNALLLQHHMQQATLVLGNGNVSMIINVYYNTFCFLGVRLKPTKSLQIPDQIGAQIKTHP